MVSKQKEFEFYTDRASRARTSQDHVREVLHHRRAILANPSYERTSRTYLNIGNVFNDTQYDKKNYKLAIHQFKHAYTVDPTYTYALFNMALSYRRDGDLQKAVSIYEDLTNITPDDHQLYLNLAFAYNKIGDSEKTIKHLEKALEINPTYGKAYSMIGKQLFKKERVLDAVENYLTAIRLNYDTDMVNYRLGKALHTTGDIEGAIQYYNKALETNSKYYHVNCYLGYVLHCKGEMEEARAQYQVALANFTDRVQVHYFYACYLWDKDERFSAIEQYCMSFQLLANKATNKERLLKVVNSDFSRLKHRLCGEKESRPLQDDIQREIDTKQLMAYLLRMEMRNNMPNPATMTQDPLSENKAVTDSDQLKIDVLSMYSNFVLARLLDCGDPSHLDSKIKSLYTDTFSTHLSPTSQLQLCLLTTAATLNSPALILNSGESSLDADFKILGSYMMESERIARLVVSIVHNLASARRQEAILREINRNQVEAVCREINGAQVEEKKDMDSESTDVSVQMHKRIRIKEEVEKLALLDLKSLVWVFDEETIRVVNALDESQVAKEPDTLVMEMFAKKMEHCRLSSPREDIL